MNSGSWLSRFFQERWATAVGRGQTIVSLWTQCFGLRRLEPRGGICQRTLATGIPIFDGFGVGRSRAFSMFFSNDYRATLILNMP